MIIKEKNQDAKGKKCMKTINKWGAGGAGSVMGV